MAAGSGRGSSASSSDTTKHNKDHHHEHHRSLSKEKFLVKLINYKLLIPLGPSQAKIDVIDRLDDSVAPRFQRLFGSSSLKSFRR